MGTLTVAELLAFIVLLGGAIVVIVRWATPAFKLATRVTKLEESSASNSERIDDTWTATMLLCRSMIAMIDHIVSNDADVASMKQVRTEMINFVSR